MNDSPDNTEVRFERVLDAMSDLVLVKGPRSRLLWANRAFREYYGLSNDELRDLLDGEHSDPDDTLQYVRDDHRVFQTAATVDVPSEPVTSHDGVTRYMHTLKDPILVDNKVVQQVGVSREIDDQERIEQSARDRVDRSVSAHSLRALVQAMPSAVVMFDATHRCLACSQEYAELASSLLHRTLSTTDLINSDYADLLESTLPLMDDLEAVLNGEVPSRRMAEFSVGGSAQRWFEIECRPWHSSTSEICGSVAMVYDTTERQSTQRALEQPNEELTQFNYRVSHDLLSPISSTRGLLNIIGENVEDNDFSETPAVLAMAQDRLLKLSNLVSELMEMARAGAANLNIVECDLVDIVDDVQKTISPEALDRPKINLDLQAPTLVTDWVRMQQVLTNLLSNALKFIDPAEREQCVTIRSRRERHETILDVIDNGEGVDQDFKDSVFTIFSRGSSQHPGHGLGLYIVKKHVDRLGGTVQVTNLRKPTVFRLRLPDPR